MAVYGGPDIVTDGLVLHLDAGNTKSYPGSGNTWFDLSGNGNHGTLGVSTAAPVFSNSNGGCLNFDGSNDTCTITNSLSTNPSISVTFGAVVNLSGYGNNYAPIILKQNNYTSLYEQYSLFLTNSSVGAAATGLDRSQKIAILNQDFRNQYVHLVGTCDTQNDLLCLYVNGVLKHSVAFTSTFDISTQNLRIGYMNTSYTGFIFGKLFMTYIYNRSLSANEINQNYLATKGRFGL